MTKRLMKNLWTCPARDCQGGRHDRQHSLTQGQLDHIASPDRMVIEESPTGAFRCSYCGCVYLRGSHQNTVVGYLDGGVLGEGWHPVKHP